MLQWIDWDWTDSGCHHYGWACRSSGRWITGLVHADRPPSRNVQRCTAVIFTKKAVTYDIQILKLKAGTLLVESVDEQNYVGMLVLIGLAMP